MLIKNLIEDNSYNIAEIEVDPAWIKDLGPDYLKYRKKWGLVNNCHLFDFPLFLEVETSYACNYRCPRCPRQAYRHTKDKGFLSKELLEKIFMEAREYCLPSIAFSHGGEPLMRNDIPQLICKAKESGILDRMFHTNGSLLNKTLSKELIESGLTKINFSLDAASEEIYEKVRPGGNYREVIENIHGFLAIKKKIGRSYPRVRVSFIVMEENKHEQKTFYKLWKDVVNVISFQQCYDFTLVKNKFNCDKGVNLNRKYKCDQLWQLLTINYKGDILVCELDYGHEYVLGNIMRDTIYDCWHSKVMGKFRELHRQNRWHEIPICLRCVNSVGKIEQ